MSIYWVIFFIELLRFEFLFYFDWNLRINNNNKRKKGEFFCWVSWYKEKKNVKNLDGFRSVQKEFPIIHPPLQLPLTQAKPNIRLHRFKLSWSRLDLFFMPDHPRQPQKPRLNLNQLIHVTLLESIRQGLQKGLDERFSKANRLNLLTTTKNANRLPLSIQRNHKVIHSKEKLTS